MHLIKHEPVPNRTLLPIPPLSSPVTKLGALVLLTLSACADPTSAPPTAESQQPSSEAHATAQAQVDALLLAASDLGDHLAKHRGEPIAAQALALTAQVERLATAAQAALAADSLESARELSLRAGQMVPLLRKLKRAVAASALPAAERAQVRAAIARVRWASVQLNRSAGRRLAELSPMPALEMSNPSLRNGPLLPGSTYWVLDEGHIDPVDAAFEDGELELSIHDETVEPDVEREHEHTIMVVKREAKVTVPDERFSFIGPVGRTFWLLPEAQLDAQAAGILWPGLAADEVEPGVFVDDALEFRFKQVLGPNGLSLFYSPADETALPDVRVDSENGLPDVMTVPAGTHQHLNWAFESAGLYLVQVEVRGRLAVASSPWVTSATETLVFVVLP